MRLGCLDRLSGVIELNKVGKMGSIISHIDDLWREYIWICNKLNVQHIDENGDWPTHLFCLREENNNE